MAATKVSICNTALRAIGAKRISSFDEDSEEAEHCRDIYDQIRLSLLRKHPWSCAKKRAILSPVSTYPSFGYAQAFLLPHDYVRVIDTSIESYEIENRYILADTNRINLIYIFDNDNEATWDPMLCEALSLKMASSMCKPITGSDAAGDSAEIKFEELIKEARNINAQERPSQDLQWSDSSYLEGRY